MDETERLSMFYEVELQNEMIDIVFGEFGFHPGSDYVDPQLITITDLELKMMLVKAYTLGSLQATSEYIALISKK